MTKKLPITLTLAIITLACMTYYYSIGMANAEFFGVKQSVDSWQKEQDIKSEEEYNNALNTINETLRIDSANPHYFVTKANIIHWGIDEGYEPVERLQDVRQAYIKATELRAAWPQTWIALARVNSFIDGFDTQTQHYINKAVATGPHIWWVNKGVVEISLNHWAALSAEQKLAFYEHLKRASKHGGKFKQVLEQGKAMNKLKPICIQLKFDKDYEEIKQSWMYSKYCN